MGTEPGSARKRESRPWPAIPRWDLVVSKGEDYNRLETLQGLSHPITGIETRLGRSFPITPDPETLLVTGCQAVRNLS